MPRIKRNTRSELDPYILSKFIAPHSQSIKFALIEDVSAMPGQGVTSMFTFGYVTGIVIGVLGAYDIPIMRIKPFIWKAAFGLSSNKQLSFDRARELFPGNLDMFSRKMDEGIVESALIAKFGERFL